MWIYEQSTGNIYRTLKGIQNVLIGIGYSGNGYGKNNPAYQSVPNEGPIPQGRYIISEPFDSPTHGPFCLRLTPLEGTNTFGRNGFLWHGDSIIHPGQASEGCIVSLRSIREMVAKDHDNILLVISGENKDETILANSTPNITSASTTETPRS